MDETTKTTTVHTSEPHSCDCANWTHKRPMRIILAIAILIVVFSTGLCFGQMHGNNNRFGYGHGKMRGHFQGNMMHNRYGKGIWQQGAPTQGSMMQFAPETQQRGIMRTINYGTDMPAIIGQPDGKL